jgi:hypothetical protein
VVIIGVALGLIVGALGAYSSLKYGRAATLFGPAMPPFHLSDYLPKEDREAR